jgi:hypothetical protein
MVAFGYLLLLAGWLVTNPPGAAPDEQAQYLRAAGLSQGQFFGRPATLPRAPGETLVQWHFQEAMASSFSLPARLAPPNLAGCYAFHPDTSAACMYQLPVEPAGSYISYVSLYPPTLYLLPALLITLAPNPTAALLLGRLGIALISMGLLGLMVRMSWTGRAASLIGPALALTPMVIFLCSNLTDSALEVAGAACFSAALWRLHREGEQVTRLTVAGLAAGGLFLGATRPTGPLWVAFALALFVIWTGAPVARLVRDPARSRLALPAGVVIAASLFSVAWSIAVRAQGLAKPQHLGHAALLALQQLGQFGQQVVGVFGWLDTYLPIWAYYLWAVAIVVAVAWAMIVGGTRTRITLAVSVVGVTAASVALAAVLFSSSGFSGQGRYFLPGVVAVPLLAGAVVAERGDLRGRWPLGLTAAVGIMVPVLQLVSWGENARRYAVGRSGPLTFFFHGAQWSPFGGWLLWAAVVAVGGACIALGMLSGVRRDLRALTE